MSKLADSLSEVRDLLQHLMTRPDISTVEAAEIFERENKTLMRRMTLLLARQQLVALAGDVARSTDEPQSMATNFFYPKSQLCRSRSLSRVPSARSIQN